MTTAHITDARVWIGCLQCYNEGDLVGNWYPAADAAEVTPSQLHGREIPAQTHEELWCFDTEGIPVRGEFSPHAATEWAEMLGVIPDHDRPAFDAWILDRGETTSPATSLVDEFQDSYLGRWDSFADYAEDFLVSTGVFDGVSDLLRDYFDFADYARDIEAEYTVLRASNLAVYVFSN